MNINFNIGSDFGSEFMRCLYLYRIALFSLWLSFRLVNVVVFV